MIYFLVVTWLLSSALTFRLFVRRALLDFGSVTVGQAILLGTFSLIPLAGPTTVLIIELLSCDSFGIFSRELWTRK